MSFDFTRRNSIFYLVSISVFLLDQASKYLALKFLAFNNSIPVIKNFIYITLTSNKGGAFGIMQNMQPFFIFVSLALFLLIVYYNSRIPKKDKLLKFSLAMLLGGSLGNIFDRIVRGGVIDFIDVRYFSVLNIADIMINIGAFLFLFGVLIKYNIRDKDSKDAPGTI